MQTFPQKFAAWLDDPFNGEMDAVGWFLMVGLVMCSIFVWTQIINQIAAD